MVVTGIVMDKGKITFWASNSAGTNMHFNRLSDITLFGKDKSRIFSLPNHNITQATEGVHVTTGSVFTLSLPIDINKVNFDRPGEVAKPKPRMSQNGIYEFGQAEVGNKTYTFQQADGEKVYGEYGWVTDLGYFDDRDDDIDLIRKKWLLLEVEQVTLPSPYSPSLDELDEVR